MIIDDYAGNRIGFKLDDPNAGASLGLVGQLAPSADGLLHGVLDLSWTGCNHKGSPYKDNHLLIDVGINLASLSSSNNPWDAIELTARSDWSTDPAEAFGRDQIRLILDRVQSAARYAVEFGAVKYMHLSSVSLIGTELETTFRLANLQKGGQMLETTLTEDIKPSSLADPTHGLTVDHLFDSNKNSINPQGIVFPNIGSWLILQGLALRHSKGEAIPWIDISGSNINKRFTVTNIPGQSQSIQLPVRVSAIAGTNGDPILEMMTMHFDSTNGLVVIDSLPNLHGVVLSNWHGPGSTPLVTPITVGSIDVFLECLARDVHFEPISTSQQVYGSVMFDSITSGLLPITITIQGVGSVTVYCDKMNHHIRPMEHSTSVFCYLGRGISGAIYLGYIT
nr:hypothetical protein [Candidatus Sigynarchaeum springense]